MTGVRPKQGRCTAGEDAVEEMVVVVVVVVVIIEGGR